MMKNAASHPLSQLSFAVAESKRVNLWPEVQTGTYSEACQIGKARAAELLDYMQRNDSPFVLGHVADAIAQRGSVGGVETGFFQVIAERALRA